MVVFVSVFISCKTFEGKSDLEAYASNFFLYSKQPLDCCHISLSMLTLLHLKVILELCDMSAPVF